MPFITYKSSAGSGKTFTLVKEYIKLCIEKPDNFRHILAITFTNKAANEMKERVIAYLTQLSSSPLDKDSPAIRFLLPEIVKETELPEKEIFKRSKQVLDSILHNYSDFAIGTIDSFVHRIIRTFSRDLKIPLNFEVEMDTDKMLSEAIDILISKAGTDEQLTRALVEFTEKKTDDEKSWNIENDLYNFSRQFLRDDSAEHIENIRKLSIKDFLNIQKKLFALNTAFENSIIYIAEDARKLIEKNNILLEDFAQGKNGIGGYFERLASGRMDKCMPTKTVRENVEKNKWASGKCTTETKAKIESIKDMLVSEFNKIMHILEKDYSNYIVYNLILANIYPVAVLSELQNVIEEIKKENNILPISEFNKKISEIIISQPVPFIYERLGEKFQHYLIDEFQDTSVLQWINLLPLIENSLGYDNFNMIVGDGKQAIYRFRGGDVEHFAALPDVPDSITDPFSRERAASIGRNYEEKFLKSNYRSKAEIVDFNNSLFGHIREKCPPYVQNIFEHCEQEFDQKNTGGYIQLDFINKGTIPEEKNFSDVTNEKILQIIKQAEQAGYRLSDMAILCRKNNNASDIARFLIEVNIDVISEESLLLNNSAEVSFLLATANIIVNRTNNLAKYRILHYLMEKGQLEDRELFPVVRKLSDNDEVISLDKMIAYLKTNHFSFDLHAMESLPLFEFFKETATIFGLQLPKNPHLQFFLDAVLEFSGKGNSTLPAFLEWWKDEADSRSVIIPEGTDAIRIMTIHKSKGLEFPVVIYPYAFKSQKSANDFLWIQPDIKSIPELKSALVSKNQSLEETRHADIYQTEVSKLLLDMLNIMYVASTRASERLYILTKTPAKDFSNPKNIPDFMASFLESKGIWEKEKSIYFFGKENGKDPSKKQKENLEPVELKNYGRKSFRQQIHLRKKSGEFWDAENPDQKTEWGNIVHFALSKINSISDVDKVIAEITDSGIILPDRIEELRTQIVKIISHPKIAGYFRQDQQVMNEKEILLENGDILRPDRIVIDGKNAAVIDYKTGNPKETHEEQISSYASALQKMGYSQVRKFLVYVGTNEVEEII
jgi:ATP-dependent exoDNAse (exonuclease V) beta subunit